MSATARTSSTASDIMARDTVTVSPSASLREALDLMIENRVSGLPVVDHQDRCVGVLSASDIMTVEQDHIAQEDESLGAYFDSDTQSWESIRIAPDDERLADLSVLDAMSNDLICVTPDTPIGKVAGTMVDSAVHRVLVMNADRELLGVVSSFDFVRLAVPQ